MMSRCTWYQTLTKQDTYKQSGIFFPTKSELKKKCQNIPQHNLYLVLHYVIAEISTCSTQ